MFYPESMYLFFPIFFQLFFFTWNCRQRGQSQANIIVQTSYVRGGNVKRACVNYILRNICHQLPWRTRPLLPASENKERNASMSEQPRPVHHAAFPPSVSQVDGTHCRDAPPYLRSIFMGARNDPRIVSADFL